MSQQKIVSPSFIGHYKLKDLSICDDLIDFHKKDPLLRKSSGKVGNDSRVNKKEKDSEDTYIHVYEYRLNKSVCPAIELYLKELNNILNKYKEEYIYSDKVDRYSIVEAINIQHYEPGAGYHSWHSERAGPSRRHLVFMTYLNDVPDGGTEFYYQDYTVEAVKGKTLIWPSDWTHTHKGQITDKHEKYIITGWFSYL